MAENNLRAAAFPKLDDDQIQSLAHCTQATLKHFEDGQKLFTVGDRDFGFYVIKSGDVAIIDDSGLSDKTVVIHGPGDFTGEESQLIGGTVIVSAVAKGPCEAYEIVPAMFRQLLNRCPDLSDLILQAFIARRQLLRTSGDFTGLRVIGSRYSQDTFRIRDFFAKNRIMFTWTDLETDPEVGKWLKTFGITEAETPVVACGQRLLQRNPSNQQLAKILGIQRPIEQMVYDLVIVGAGPSGLAAAVYGSSEGLRTLVLERTAPGGQAGSSMRIENYLGFPTGIIGSELADRAVIQASKFGAILNVADPVVTLSFDKAYPVIGLGNGEVVTAKCLLIATGADYRRLDVEGCETFEGRGVYYAATPNEAIVCQGSDVVVVGGGNSAGQAAVFLSAHARKVYFMVRGDSLYKSMSSYLAQRIEQTAHIEVMLNTEVTCMMGDTHLGAVEVRHTVTGQTRVIDTPALFSFIGAIPRTEWLPEEIERDAKNFVKTGLFMPESSHWPVQRQAFLLETSRPGVFAAGDVRSGSIKRVASAVGEGAMVVQFVHEYLRGI